MAETKVSPEEYISAAELEKFGYCPLSWWYSRQGSKESDTDVLDAGVKSHEEIERQLKLVHEYEFASREAETTVAIFSVVATVIALVSLAISLYVTAEWSLATIAIEFRCAPLSTVPPRKRPSFASGASASRRAEYPLCESLPL